MKDLSRFNEMGDHPEKFSICTSISQTLNGFAFRYFWATDGLSEDDLSYQPGNEGRTIYQTLNHIYKMIDFLGCTIEGTPSDFPETDFGFSLDELRENTLDRIEAIRDSCSSMADETLTEKKIKINFQGTPVEYPLWYLFNGPLPDAFYHLGQIVSFRRTIGKPVDPYLEPFVGKRIVPEAS